MAQNHLSGNVKILWFLPALLLIFAVWALAFLSILLLPENERISTLNTILYAAAISLLIAIPAYAYITQSYRHFYYELGEEEIIIHEGIFEKHAEIIPYAKIQNIRTERTLFENLIGLVHIHIETAGSVHSERQPKIPGVPVDDHENLIELISLKAKQTRSSKQACPQEPAASNDVLKAILYQLKLMDDKLAQLVETKNAFSEKTPKTGKKQ